MEQRTNFLALMLLDALEDEDKAGLNSLLERNNIDASYVPRERGIAPLHYVCGMENEELAIEMLTRFLVAGANPNTRCEGNVTALHIAAMYGRLELVRLLLQHGAQVHVYDDENKLPVHYAIEEYHFEVLKLLRDQIFLEKCERQQLERRQLEQQQQQQQRQSDKQKTTLEKQSSIDFNQVDSTSTPNRTTAVAGAAQKQHKQLLSVSGTAVAHVTPDKHTPNRLNYNYDVTSPYYINITHRRNKPQPKFPPIESRLQDTTTAPELTQAVNIFSLTKENLAELTHNATQQTELRSRGSLIENWRAKVERSRARQSLLQQYEDMEQLVEQAIENDNFNLLEYQRKHKAASTTTNTDAEDSGAEMLPEETANKSTGSRMVLNEIVQQVAKARVVVPPPPVIVTENEAAESSFHTAAEEIIERKQLIRSPKNDEYFLQMTEAYVHTDDENGLVFYETKLLNNLGNKMAHEAVKSAAAGAAGALVSGSEHDSTANSNITLPLDYETDALRAELTQFGETVGPITKSTKRLYIKRLIKYKRNTLHMMELRKHAKATELKYSVELQRTLRSEEDFKRIEEYFRYESMSAAHFVDQSNVTSLAKRRQLREGHLKQSFIYMLIDPNISCNLPGESIFLDKFSVWQRFLDAIFYVGKGKSSRPYAHLYDAMKTHSRAHQKQLTCAETTRQKISIRKQTINTEIFKSPQKLSTTKNSTTTSKKLERILEIWRRGQGVVCLHVFHNIMPTDAYTREASIIDALALKHLTNMKRGDYYGPAQAWTMKEKKQLGIALLYKAMHIYLAEGESQLSPSDLI